MAQKFNIPTEEIPDTTEEQAQKIINTLDKYEKILKEPE